jgi:UDP-glucose 4-epimerase
MKKTCLIAGGAGKFGSEVAKAAANLGWQCVSFDDLSSGQSDRVKFGPLVKADVREKARVLRALREYSVRQVFHCALWEDDETKNVEDIYSQHLESILSLVQAMKEAGGGELSVLAAKSRTNEMLTRILADCEAADPQLKLRMIVGVSDIDAISEVSRILGSAS